MKKKFKSKIGLELAVPLAMVLGVVWLFSINAQPSWVGTVILLPMILAITLLFATTNYTIEGEQLTIRCGFLYHKKINIKQVKKITETNNPLSAPATSLDRLQITHHQAKDILISPKHKKEFIAAMLALNPNIEVVYKNK
jgi:membrane protein YdbS with pleckstrin-like domain